MLGVDQSLADLIRARIGAGTGVAVVHDGAEIGREAFLATIRGRQNQLEALAAGTPVIVPSRRGAAMWSDLAALWGLGLVPVPVDPQVPVQHKQAIAAKAQPKAILGAEADAAAFGGIACFREPAPAAPEMIVRGGGASQLGAILFTSGSTGQPKGVLLSQGAVLGNSLAIQTILPLEPSDRLAIAVPYHFTSAICHYLAAATRGACLVGTERSLLPSDLHRMLLERGATAFGGAPIQLRWIAECATEETKRRLRWIMSSGDHLGTDVIEILRCRLPGTQIVTVYGLTEVGGRFCALPPDLVDAHAGSVGRPIPGMQVEVLADDGGAAPPGEIGQIHAFGDYVFDGYVADPAITAETRTARGGFLTGDIGYLDEQGLLYVVGRTDDVFKCSGQKVSTIPIYDATMQTGLFADVAVVPTDDPIAGKVPWVYYVLKGGAEFRKGEVLRRLRSILPLNHMPQRFVPVPLIPRTGTGKLQRARLREIIASESAAAPSSEGHA